MNDLNNTKPVFILGSERSGTNLLRSLLSNHSNLHGPLSPHFIQEFGNFSRYYSPLSNKSNARNLFEDMLAIANHPYTNWSLILDFEYAWNKYRPKCFFDFFNLLYLESTLGKIKKRYVCKEINIWNHIFQILAYYDDARFVYIYRDPRDYVASWMKKPLFIKTPYDAIKYWLHDQKFADMLINTQGLKVHPIKYEELITNPELIMRGVLEYIDEPVETACFETDRNRENKLSWNPYWENLGQPVNNKSQGNYSNIINYKTLNMIETLAGYDMERLGYSLETKGNWTKPIFMALANSINRRLVQFKMRDHIYKKMKLLHSKIELIQSKHLNAKFRYSELRNR